jgi:hypothetical protein
VRPVVSVQIDIARFCWEVMRRNDSELSLWIRGLVDCLATRDPSKHEYGANLLADVEEFREKEKQRKAKFSNGKTRKDMDSAGTTYTDSINTNDACTDLSCTELSTNPTTDSKRDTVPPRARLQTPSDLAEMTAYGAEISLSPEECAKAYDYYASKGWKVGNASMKDWKAALRNWKRNVDSRPNPVSRPNGSVQGFKTQFDHVGDLGRASKAMKASKTATPGSYPIGFDPNMEVGQ